MLETPVFGHHAIGPEAKRRWDSFRQSLIRTGAYPDLSIWPPDTIRETQRLNPRLIAVDGMEFEPTLDRAGLFTDDKWLSLPGNPFKLRSDKTPSFILEGDVPTDPLILVKNRYRDYLQFYYPKGSLPQAIRQQQMARFYSRELVHRSALDYWETLPDQDIEDQNEGVARSEKGVIGYKYLGEVAVSKLLFGGAFLNYLHRGYHHKGISRRRGIILMTSAIIGGLNNSRLATILAVPRDEVLYHTWVHPLTSIIPTANAARFRLQRLDLRNALVSIKSREGADFIYEADNLEGNIVPVFGTAHKFGLDLWNDPKTQNRIAAEGVSDLLGIIENQLLLLPKDTDEDLVRRYIADSLAEFLGGTAVWKVNGEAPARFTPEEVRKKITKYQTFISPTINRLVREVVLSQSFVK